MLPDKWKIIRMGDSPFYDPQLLLVDMRQPPRERVHFTRRFNLYVTGVINRLEK